MRVVPSCSDLDFCPADGVRSRADVFMQPSPFMPGLQRQALLFAASLVSPWALVVCFSVWVQAITSVYACDSVSLPSWKVAAVTFAGLARVWKPCLLMLTCLPYVEYRLPSNSVSTLN